MGLTSGLSAMIRLAAALELDRENAGVTMETLSIGHPEDSYDYALEIAGQWLCYSVAIHGSEVRTGASLVDSISQPQTLLRTPDAESGWELVFRFISALEKYGVRSLVRPILVGEPGQPDAWVIA
jgi:hypothetical protein